MSYLNKDLFTACFVYLILSQKILAITSNIKNLTLKKIVTNLRGVQENALV